MTQYCFDIVPRYAEIDQQGVVFNGHYLTWFDEACTGLFDHLGVSYPDLIADQLDMQVVHTEIDFRAPVRWRETVRIAVQCERIGTTSFTLGFTVQGTDSAGHERPRVCGSNVYVVVSTTDWSKRPVPEDVRNALSSVAGQ
ncbi:MULTISPECIES: thioesterase family protein [unclassified Mycolicibacterium]|uniref:acyl-CoA thioesterase n=1 Tax=unclassified Mycolicibacterium TaxID=2636767 RepID=UPI00130BBA7A|nr:MULTISPECIES: thioesterase family protein [unclassified Mycolicibacterium]MUL85530.1 acyl-CoA thioesterase [Mycolicibacterium sp. CBMA 329]MUL88706.1 acyl-CoA thioesterase [Mycolicibacterium sp. CBMA 331]MUM02000.1 acyl-CoA thioesterase [Mycolicibacterium sp. CBMA 334]MUM26906.1 acyl-CoA thioesterase [Mycolicibacterium sp. CBMA 295]MUM40353.1 acyl-CoA thioesterase [Mycolicibacterium sp. CBMA 247]